MNSLEILEAARERISDDGWMQNVLRDSRGRVCALGSIWDRRRANGEAPSFDRITLGTWNDDPAVIALAGVLPEPRSSDLTPAEYLPVKVSDFNDHHSQKCVLAAFDAAIELATLNA